MNVNLLIDLGQPFDVLPFLLDDVRQLCSTTIDFVLPQSNQGVELGGHDHIPSTSCCSIRAE